MTLLEKEPTYWHRPGSFSIDIDRIRSQTKLTNDIAKFIVMGKARVIKRETIQVPHGKYDTFLVEVDMDDINSLFKKSKNAKLSIWVTADDSRIPVQIKSKVSIGSFIAQLVSHEEGTP